MPISCIYPAILPSSIVLSSNPNSVSTIDAIFDTTVAILRRVRDHRPIMAPDRGHFHHNLIDMGFSQKQAVGIMYAISALLGISAVILTGFGMERALLLLIIAIVFVIATLILRNTHQNDEEEK